MIRPLYPGWMQKGRQERPGGQGRAAASRRRRGAGGARGERGAAASPKLLRARAGRGPPARCVAAAARALCSLGGRLCVFVDEQLLSRHVAAQWPAAAFSIKLWTAGCRGRAAAARRAARACGACMRRARDEVVRACLGRGNSRASAAAALT